MMMMVVMLVVIGHNHCFFTKLALKALTLLTNTRMSKFVGKGSFKICKQGADKEEAINSSKYFGNSKAGIHTSA
jgi:hypothetical protein